MALAEGMEEKTSEEAVSEEDDPSTLPEGEAVTGDLLTEAGILNGVLRPALSASLLFFAPLAPSLLLLFAPRLRSAEALLPLADSSSEVKGATVPNLVLQKNGRLISCNSLATPMHH